VCVSSRVRQRDKGKVVSVQDVHAYGGGGRRGSSTYLLTYSMEQSLDKLTGFQLVKEFPTFYGTQTFITAFTSARNLPLS
jgi:hypothetical protein